MLGIRCFIRSTFGVDQKQKAPVSFPHQGFCFLALAVYLPPVAPRALNTRGTLFLPLGGSLLARGLWYSAKLENILGDLGNRPGFWSSLHEHIGFHDLATDWPQ